MLKLNPSGGKLDIVFSEEKPFALDKRSETKVSPRRNTVSRTSHLNQTKKSSLSTKSQRTSQASKGRESKQHGTLSRTSRKEAGTRQGRTSRAKDRRANEKEAFVDPNRVGRGGQHDAGIVTQGQLFDILNLIKSGNQDSSVTREQLSELIASVDASSLPEKHVATKQALPKEESRFDRNPEVAIKQSDLVSKTPRDNNSELDKNAQWKKELDDQVALARMKKDKQNQKDKFEEYNPWGRPGAGAPIRTQSGNVLADFHKRTQVQSSSTADVFPTGQVRTTAPASDVYHQHQRPAPVATVGSVTSNTETGLPVAMRSSFAIGAPGLVSNETQLSKAAQNRMWMEELEKQIAEKKEREKQQKFREHNEDLANVTWAQQHQDQTRSPPKDPLPRHQTEANGVHGIPQTTTLSLKPQASQPQLSQPQLSQPQATGASSMSPQYGNQGGIPVNVSLDGSFKSHARGYGMHSMDPQSMDEMSRKRQKMLEHQRAIQEQVEEKRRIKQEAKDKRLREEAIEEARLAEERDMLNQQFSLELKRKQSKEEEAKRRSEALQQSVLEAYESAQQAKMDKRRHHLEAGSHNTSGVKAQAGDVSARSYVISQGPQADEKPTITSRNQAGSVAGLHGKTSVMSTYSPRKPKTSSTSLANSYDSHSSVRFKAADKDYVVPALELPRADSPPVPTLRNKTVKSSRVASPVSNRSKSRSVKSPISNRRGNLSRTTSSQSEPYESRKSNTRKSRLDHIVTPTPREEPISARVLPEEDYRPFSPIEDAFVIPYHRTLSATLPVAPDTPSTPEKGKGKDAGGRGKVVPPGDGYGVTPMYRTPTTHLKDDKPQHKISPRRGKGGRVVAVTNHRQPQQKTQAQNHPRTSVPSRIPTKKPSVETVATKKPSHRNIQARSRQEMLVQEKLSPRLVDHSSLSNHTIPDLQTTARQELILEQLKALRQGLIMKERELQQDL